MTEMNRYQEYKEDIKRRPHLFRVYSMELELTTSNYLELNNGNLRYKYPLKTLIKFYFKLQNI